MFPYRFRWQFIRHPLCKNHMPWDERWLWGVTLLGIVGGERLVVKVL